MITLTTPIRNGLHKRWVIAALDITFLAVAVVSLAYTIVTAPRNGIDFFNYYQAALDWVGGFTSGNESIDIYPPYGRPVLSPLALFSFERARVLWLGVNLLAAGICIWLALVYFKGWPFRARYYLALLMVSWAPFRVGLRVGQLSLIITALILGSFVARSRKRKYLAGVLLGLALCKFTLSFPFFLYFLWKKEWRSLATAVSVIIVLTEVYAFRLGLSLVEVVRNYSAILGGLSVSTESLWIGSTGIKPLLVWVTGGNTGTANLVWVLLLIMSLVALAVVFSRTPQAEQVHVAILSLFALWAVYHRTYDSVLYILPVGVLIDWLIQKRHVTFSIFWLAATSLLILSLPGLLTSRLGISEEVLSRSAPGLIALHLERILTFGMFVSFLFVLWKERSAGSTSLEESLREPEQPGYTNPPLTETSA